MPPGFHWAANEEKKTTSIVCLFGEWLEKSLHLHFWWYQQEFQSEVSMHVCTQGDAHTSTWNPFPLLPQHSIFVQVNYIQNCSRWNTIFCCQPTVKHQWRSRESKVFSVENKSHTCHLFDSFLTLILLFSQLSFTVTSCVYSDYATHTNCGLSGIKCPFKYS